jgi:hypothetical protein
MCRFPAMDSMTVMRGRLSQKGCGMLYEKLRFCPIGQGESEEYWHRE